MERTVATWTINALTVQIKCYFTSPVTRLYVQVKLLGVFLRAAKLNLMPGHGPQYIG